MRVPLEWLAHYVELDMPSDELAHALTMSGLKVEMIERIGDDWNNIYVGHVVQIDPHPTSRKPLQVARVDLGTRVITLVTGAPNVSLGNKVPVVLVGGYVPHGPDGGPMLIEARLMAGITSEGMMASAYELGISDEHTGIYILPSDVPTGALLQTVLGDVVFEIETNPNRADTLSIFGIAREVAAVTGRQLRLPELDSLARTPSSTHTDSVAVDVQAPDLCPRYSALRIGGLSARESPHWMQERLRHAGQRPINLLVDITNYVMLEYGQPLHAFDARQLEGNLIVVRRAHDGEEIRTLDGVLRTLGPANLVIADGERAVGIAGVMGGENSEIADDTTEIVLEAANFDPVNVRRTAQGLALRTEASARFEKSLPAETTVLALKRALQLLADIMPTPLAVGDLSDTWDGPEPERVVIMPMRDLHRLIGIDITPEVARESLNTLGFEVVEKEQALAATVPYWRRADVSLSADLVEEVARLVGFDAVPVTLPPATMPPAMPHVGLSYEGVVRERLLALGASEALSHSLTSTTSMDRLTPPGSPPEDWSSLVANLAGVRTRQADAQPVRLANPATRDRAVTRLLLLPSLLDVLARNLKHTDEQVMFFEIARTFFWRDQTELPYERRTLAIAMSGLRSIRSWNNSNPGPFTFFDVKGVLEGVVDALRIDSTTVEPGKHPSLHPGRSAVLRLDGHDVAWFGELRPDVAAAFDLDGRRVQVAEVDLDSLFECVPDAPIFQSLPRFPAVYRDLAVVVKQDVPAMDLLTTAQQAAGALLEDARIFDVYQGAPLSENQKSVAIGMTFRAADMTLTQEDAAAAVDRVMESLVRERDARIRA